MMQTRTQLYVCKSSLTKGGQGMFLGGKTVEAGIVFALLIGGMFVAGLRSFAVESELTQEALRVTHQNDVKKMQLALQDRGHYSGQVDGVIGLRTRASIRAFQKTENLPTTGLLDAQTALKLGVKPDSIKTRSTGARQDIVGRQGPPGTQSSTGKPWAGTSLTQGRKRIRKTPPKTIPTGAAPEDKRGHREDGLRAEN
jgi:peptidoglycan hydrolase-like protein with peptidoglycan-binding domain